MLVDIIPLDNHLKHYKQKFNFTTSTPIIVVDGHADLEEYFWLGRDLCDINRQFNRLKLVEQNGNHIVEYLGISNKALTPEVLRTKRYHELGITLLSMRIFKTDSDANINGSNMVYHGYFPAGIGNTLYEHLTGPDQREMATIPEALPAELWYLSTCPTVGKMYSLPEQPTGIIQNGSIVGSDDDADVGTFFGTLNSILDRTKLDSMCTAHSIVLNTGISATHARWEDKPFMHTMGMELATREFNGTGGTFPLSIMMQHSRYQGGRYSSIPRVAPFPVTDDVLTGGPDTPACNDILHAVNKYIEQLPYTEVAFTCTKRDWKMCTYCAYSPNQMIQIKTKSQEDVFGCNEIYQLKEYLWSLGLLFSPYTPLKSVSLYRSFNDDAYITLVYADGTVKKYYFDFVYLALGCRSMLDGYECSWFAPSVYR